MRFRILPVMIGVAALTLGLRVGEIWSGAAAIAEAEDTPADSVQVAPRDPFADVQLASARDVAPPRPDDGVQLAQADTGNGGAGTGQGGAQTAELPANPLSMSDERIELLQRLSKRRKELDKREAEVKQREAELKAVEKRLEKKVQELKSLKKEINGLLVEYDKQQSKQVKRLVRIYESMDPEDAARIFENLGMDVLLKVVDRMSERNTAPILAEMAPKKAQALTRKLADRRDLPNPQQE
ncbi:Flagellar motility protein MotE, a chaperone for MotC folding [Limimonas halophila]|uniref:Flagellar motility protein MotE, a chaperone for MotC folding n=1 Tax=Limimonas halophila TaxID=1082479 RepID=A0A1G7Q5W1_9PROT|nr:MotE family protein [Limimonas halophila]SDF93942.1 Flagellar motility protein MotE, a chaperone for MotC folding [Limimonas halophila]